MPGLFFPIPFQLRNHGLFESSCAGRKLLFAKGRSEPSSPTSGPVSCNFTSVQTNPQTFIEGLPCVRCCSSYSFIPQRLSDQRQPHAVQSSVHSAVGDCQASGQLWDKEEDGLGLATPSLARETVSNSYWPIAISNSLL